MLTVTISALDRDSVTNDEHYLWLKRHMYAPLDILGLNFMHDTGEIFSIAVKCPNADAALGFDVIVIFVWNYNTVYKLGGRCIGNNEDVSL